MRIAFAGDRDISVQVLKFIISRGVEPLALMVSSPQKASHADELIRISNLSSDFILVGAEFKNEENIKKLKRLNLDYIIGVHFPYLVPLEILEIPKSGFLNLHPAYLPFNKGWHTPSWAILEGTPVGGTLHFMTEKIDAGDIICQKKVDVMPNDTANTLYKKIKDVEYDVFVDAWASLCSNSFTRKVQDAGDGTEHVKQDLLSEEIQLIDLNKDYKAKTLIDKLRGLTTSNIKESAVFIENDKKYRITINIIQDDVE